jgi:hypothetical protein
MVADYVSNNVIPLTLLPSEAKYKKGKALANPNPDFCPKIPIL